MNTLTCREDSEHAIPFRQLRLALNMKIIDDLMITALYLQINGMKRLGKEEWRLLNSIENVLSLKLMFAEAS